MDAPLLAQRLRLNPDAGAPLSRQLYEQLKRLILTGTLPAQSLLPASRALAASLNVSRNTVVEALNQLHAEGYTQTNRRGGTRIVPLDKPMAVRGTSVTQLATPRLSRRGEQLARQPQRAALHARAFTLGIPDLTAFPHMLFARLLGRAARRGAHMNVSIDVAQGHGPLREALAAHLVQARGLRCQADQIVIMPGAQAGLDLLARLLIDDGDSVWLEDPCYRGATAAFGGAGARLAALPVDGEGITLPQRVRRAPRLIYVTPSHQFPLGMVTSLARRLALIEMAGDHDAFVLEDDYDSEFRYEGQPIASLQGLDDSGRIIYVGSFAKTMLPSLRVGYLVLPPALVEPVRQAQRTISASVPLVVQAAIAEFMSEGHYRAHVRRMRNIYEARRNQLIEILRVGLDELAMDIAGAGMHIVLHLPQHIDDARIAQAAARQGIDVAPISQLALGRNDLNGLLLGFGNVQQAQIAQASGRLIALIRSATNSRHADSTP